MKTGDDSFTKVVAAEWFSIHLEKQTNAESSGNQRKDIVAVD
jgi:hypothetical protein